MLRECLKIRLAEKKAVVFLVLAEKKAVVFLVLDSLPSTSASRIMLL